MTARHAARYPNYLGMPGLMLPTSMYQKDMKIIGLDDIPNLTEIMMIADLYTSGSYPLDAVGEFTGEKSETIDEN